MNRIRGVVGLLTIILLAAGCGFKNNESITNDQNLVQRQQLIYQKAQPIPLYDFSEQRNTLIQIYNAKNEARQTWALFQSTTGVPVYPYVCPSIGLPIPGDAQLSNPEQITAVHINGGWQDGVVPQAEPDGIYTSHGTDSTFVVCIRNNGQPELVYTEAKVTSVSHEVIFQNGQFVDTGKAPTITLDMRGGTGTIVEPETSPHP